MFLIRVEKIIVRFNIMSACTQMGADHPLDKLLTVKKGRKENKNIKNISKRNQLEPLNFKKEHH